MSEPTARIPAPQTSLDHKLAALWAGILGLDHVDPFASFFDLGGILLAGLRVVNQLSETLGQRISPAIFIEAQPWWRWRNCWKRISGRGRALD